MRSSSMTGCRSMALVLLAGIATAHRPQEKDLQSMMQAESAEVAQVQAADARVDFTQALDAEAKRRIEDHIIGNASLLMKDRNNLHLYCNDWCIKCAPRTVRIPEAGSHGGYTQETREAYWKVKRGQDKFKLLARGVFVVAATVAVGTSAFVSGGVSLVVAGAVAKLGVSMLLIKVAGGIAAGLLVQDLLTKPRDCPNVAFSQVISQKSHWWNRFHSSQEEEYFEVADLNLYELMYNVEARTVNGQTVPGVQGERTRMDWPGEEGATLQQRNQRRMLMALSCNALMFKEELWAEQVFKSGDEHLRMIGRDKDFGSELVSHCGQWLCAGDVESVQKISVASTGSCGGRWFDFFKHKTGAQQKYIAAESVGHSVSRPADGGYQQETQQTVDPDDSIPKDFTKPAVQEAAPSGGKGGQTAGQYVQDEEDLPPQIVKGGGPKHVQDEAEPMEISVGGKGNFQHHHQKDHTR